MIYLQEVLIYLAAMVIAVPLANRLGFGSVLGYLIAGMVIGPIFKLISDTQELQQIAEFGVVVMLFLVGLELEPHMLWKMRNKLLGLGGAQVIISAAIIGSVAYFSFEKPWQSSLAIGFILALSSTAIVLQTLKEKGWFQTDGGRASFSVLLFQDIAVIPLIAFMPLLSVLNANGADHSGEASHAPESLISGLPVWAQIIATLAVIVAIIIGGIYLSRPMFRFISHARLREIYTAAALFFIVSVAVLMSAVGLSPALGAFLAGVVLSTSEYRHELESDLAPFKGLLLGLFFITVGAGINFALLARAPWFIIGLAFALIALKFLVLWTLGFISKLPLKDRWLFSLGLAQAGEFGFVLLALARVDGVLEPEVIETLTLVIAITMVATPFLFMFFENVIAPRASTSLKEREADIVGHKGTVIVAGIGRFGQVVARVLSNSGYECVMFDYDIDQIERFRRLGIRAYFGDATRPDLLHAAGVDEARLFIASLEDREKQLQLVSYLKRHHPNLVVAARAFDRGHYYELKDAGADIVEREAFEGSIMLGRKSLVALGENPYRALQLANKFRVLDVSRMLKMQKHWSGDGVNEDTIRFAREMNEEQDRLMKQDREANNVGGLGWTPPPKGAWKTDEDPPEQ